MLQHSSPHFTSRTHALHARTHARTQALDIARKTLADAKEMCEILPLIEPLVLQLTGVRADRTNSLGASVAPAPFTHERSTDLSRLITALHERFEQQGLVDREVDYRPAVSILDGEPEEGGECGGDGELVSITGGNALLQHANLHDINLQALGLDLFDFGKVVIWRERMRRCAGRRARHTRMHRRSSQHARSH
jgi:hypothetical protein